MNFAVVGQDRCGASIVQTSLCTHPKAYCHGELLHQAPKRRQMHHEAYFGESQVDMLGCWQGREMSPESYLNHRIFDQPRCEESAIGVRLTYSQLQTWDLWEYLRQMTLGGDFCVIHVTRNPVACWVSLKQARESGTWGVAPGTILDMDVPEPVHVRKPAELTEFCRQHAAWEERVRQVCDDRLEISYQELFLDYHHVMAEVFSFLSLPQHAGVCCGTRRLKNREIHERIADLPRVMTSVPHDVQAYFHAADLF